MARYGVRCVEKIYITSVVTFQWLNLRMNRLSFQNESFQKHAKHVYPSYYSKIVISLFVEI